MEFIVETIIKGEKTQTRIEARNFIEAENMVRNPAIQNGEKVVDVQYGDNTGVSVIQSIIEIERRIYLAKK